MKSDVECVMFLLVMVLFFPLSYSHSLACSHSHSHCVSVCVCIDSKWPYYLNWFIYTNESVVWVSFSFFFSLFDVVTFCLCEIETEIRWNRNWNWQPKQINAFYSNRCVGFFFFGQLLKVTNYFFFLTRFIFCLP